MDEQKSADLLVCKYRNTQKDRPVFQGFEMSMMIVEGEPSIHIVLQYIHITRIWQEDNVLNDQFPERQESRHSPAFRGQAEIGRSHALHAWTQLP